MTVLRVRRAIFGLKLCLIPMKTEAARPQERGVRNYLESAWGRDRTDVWHVGARTGAACSGQPPMTTPAQRADAEQAVWLRGGGGAASYRTRRARGGHGVRDGQVEAIIPFRHKQDRRNEPQGAQRVCQSPNGTTTQMRTRPDSKEKKVTTGHPHVKRGREHTVRVCL